MLSFLKKIKKKNWRYNYFTAVYQKSGWSFFSPPPPPAPPPNPKKSAFWKNEKKLLKISSFYTSVSKTTIIWGAVPGTDRILAILGQFLPYYPLTIRKIKILKKWKKHLQMSSFYKCVWKIAIIWSMLPAIWSVTDIIFCHFLPF